jgi:hypothetical protein
MDYESFLRSIKTPVIKGIDKRVIDVIELVVALSIKPTASAS